MARTGSPVGLAAEKTAGADNAKGLAVALGCVEAVEGGGRVDAAGLLAAGRERVAAGR